MHGERDQRKQRREDKEPRKIQHDGRW
jgi:hypothetical protein